MYIRARKGLFTPDDVTSLRDGAGFVKRDFTVAALAAEPAIIRHNQLLGWNVFQRFANFHSHLFRTVRLQHAMAHCADADLLFQIVLEWRKQLDVFLSPVSHLQRPYITTATLQINFD